MSTDGGATFPTVLAANTPNDGTQSVTMPGTAAPYCRIMIEAVGNIRYFNAPIFIVRNYAIHHLNRQIQYISPNIPKSRNFILNTLLNFVT